MPRDKKTHITKLKALLKDADELFLATDEDREGEAIAWHLLDELKPKGIPVKRMVFHEITKQAILAAVDNPREIDMDLVEAQEARRILDRLYGYEVSPVLWKKVMSGLSAGRVQSVATRLVVDRERRRMRFRPASYWDLEGTFDAGADHDQRMFPAKLHSRRRQAGRPRLRLRPRRRAQGRGRRRRPPRPRRAPRRLVAGLHDTHVRRALGRVQALHAARRTRRSAPRRCSRRPAASSASAPRSTMSVAQRLYENGFITYMRTDSTTLSGTAIDGGPRPGRASCTAPSTCPTPRAPTPRRSRTPRRRTRRSGPPVTRFRTPAQTGLTGDQFRLYELIWMRTVASQMKDAVGHR